MSRKVTWSNSTETPFECGSRDLIQTKRDGPCFMGFHHSVFQDVSREETGVYFHSEGRLASKLKTVSVVGMFGQSCPWAELDFLKRHQLR